MRCSRAAERLMNALVRLGRLGVMREVRLVLKWVREDRQQLLERAKVVVLLGRLNDMLHPVVPRYESRIDRAHGGPACGPVLWFFTQPLPPARGPTIIGR